MKLRIYILSLLSLSFIVNASAQFDDLYYDPYKDGEIATSSFEQENNDNYGNGYDDQSYAYYDEYNDDEYYEEYDDYEYSSRVRKFRRPAFSMGYYSPIWGYSYRDYIYDNYDPFYNPYWYGGNSVVIVVGNPGWGWNRWNRWNSWNNWGCGYNSWNNWGWNSWGGNNYYVNNYYGNSWGNGWGNGWNNGWGNNGGWNHNNNNNNNNNSPYGNYYGSRKSGSSIASTEGRKEGPRRSVTTTPPTDRNPIAKDALTQADQKDMNPGSSGRSESTRTRRTDFNDKPHKSSIYDRRTPETSTKPDNGGVRQSERKDGYSRENNNNRSERRSENVEKDRQSPRSGKEPSSSRTPSRNENRSYESPKSSSSSSRSSGGSYNGGSSGRSSSSGSSGGSSSGRSGSSRRG